MSKAGTRGASSEERWAQGARDAQGPGYRVGVQPQLPGVGWEGCGAREARQLRQRSFRDAERARASETLGASFGEPDPGEAVAPGRRERVTGVRVLVRLLQDPGLGTKGIAPLAGSTAALLSLPFSVGLLGSGAAHIPLLGNLAALSLGRPAPRQEGQVRAAEGAGPPGAGNHAESDPV